MKGYKPSRQFESRTEMLGSFSALGACALLSLAALAFMVPAVKGAVAAFKENASVYRPAGELVTKSETPLSMEALTDISARIVVPGVEVRVVPAQNGRPQGIELASRAVTSMRDFSDFRAAIDRVMLAQPDAQWGVAHLCAGTGCEKGNMAYALLTASKLNISSVEAGQGRLPRGLPSAEAQ